MTTLISEDIVQYNFIQKHLISSSRHLHLPFFECPFLHLSRWFSLLAPQRYSIIDPRLCITVIMDPIIQRLLKGCILDSELWKVKYYKVAQVLDPSSTIERNSIISGGKDDRTIMAQGILRNHLHYKMHQRNKPELKSLANLSIQN
jgi:hypothetical protein